MKDGLKSSKLRGTFGTVGFPKSTMLQNAIFEHIREVSLSKPAPVFRHEMGGEIIGKLKSIDYNELEGKAFAQIILDDHVHFDFETTRTFSFGHACGKTHLAGMIEERRKEKLEEANVEPMVPISVYNMIKNF